ncbi:MAG: BPSS1780 family membrane protein [Proteobacteria bacterium]|nr:BPSS1780 family membrane protein [Pseudomonadota bacterium]
MHARIVSWRAGARWLPEGWRLFRVAPFGWLGLVFAYWLLMTFISLVPILGVVAAIVLVPPFAVGFMAASRAAAGEATVEIGQLFAGFRTGLRGQLVLGAAYVAGLALVFAGATLADGGVLVRVMLGARPMDPQTVRDGGFALAMLAAAVLYLPVMMAFWFSPVLVAWQAMPPFKALFYSFFACVMNWRAFLAYGIITAVVTVAIPFVVLSVFAMLAKGAEPVPVGRLLLPLIIILLPVLYASFYAGYRDIFAADEHA